MTGMLLNRKNCVFALVFFFVQGLASAQSVSGWVTTPDRKHLLERISDRISFAPGKQDPGAIQIDDAMPAQSIDGFGFALTSGSAELLMKMDTPSRRYLLREIFGRESGAISVSYIRVSIGASDLNSRLFTYDDRPKGETDPRLVYFNLLDDRFNVVPVLKEIRRINPAIKIVASPWSAPAWMKTNEDLKGGNLKKEFYSVYARYFVKYLRTMAEAGISINAVTIQNEPLNEGNTPSMAFSARDESDFIKNNLGPLLRQEGLPTKIIIYDHNCDRPDYPVTVLEDPGAARYVDGSGFHLYGGHIDALSEVHNRFPGKAIYFTEQMVVDGKEFAIGAQVERLIIGATRNWSRNVLLWNLAADKNNGPHTSNGGCTMCQGALTLDKNAVQRNLAYYVIAHASRFVPPGSVRIRSTQTDQLSDVVFRTPAGKWVMIVANNTLARHSFSVSFHGKTFSSALDAGAAATYEW